VTLLSADNKSLSMYMRLDWTVFIKYLLIKVFVHLQSSQFFSLHVGTLIMLPF